MEWKSMGKTKVMKISKQPSAVQIMIDTTAGV
jgi:hypothetical protein